jgi:SAM-dependent methyltransferase
LEVDLLNAARHDWCILNRLNEMYQTFGDQRAASKSAAKLERLQLPDLTGKSVLDLGCNEGFFCIEAKRRGAALVCGVDSHAPTIAAAQARAAKESLDIDFVCSDFLEAPRRHYDVLLFLSALHYVKEPIHFFEFCTQLLRPDGVLVLECGVQMGSDDDLHRVLRSRDERFYPSLNLLYRSWLKDFAPRLVGKSVNQSGDPIDRFVFHCNKRKTEIVLILGRGKVGKSSIAARFAGATIIHTDALLRPVRNKEKVFLPPSQAAFDEARKDSSSGIAHAWKAVREDPTVLKYYAELVTSAIRLNNGAKTIVVEGYILLDIANEIRAALGDQFVIWEMQPPAA